jgi:hypothetical protein
MASDLQVSDALLASVQSALNGSANRLSAPQRTLSGQDTAPVGAAPLAGRLADAQGNLAGGLGILGQALASLARFASVSGTSFTNTDDNLGHEVPR